MVSRTLSVHNEHEFLLKMEKAGLSEELAQKVIDSKHNELARKVVRFIQNGGFKLTTSQKRARKIMGKNMFRIEEAIQHFAVNPTRQQILALSEIPFSGEVLQKVKDTHVLMAVFPLSILEIRSKVERKLFYGHEDAWYNKQAFAKECGETSWQLVRKTTVDNSTSKNWEEQQALIPKEDEVPTAQVMVYTIIGHYLDTGEHLFERIYVRTSSVDSDGSRVLVGLFDSFGLSVDLYWGDGRDDCLAVSSARKFPA